MSEPNTWGEEGLAVLRAASADAPRSPGVYFFLAEGNEILYVGKATNLRQRLRQHAAGGIPQSQLHQRYDLRRRQSHADGNHTVCSPGVQGARSSG